jgi:hypothetical protein
VPSLGQLGGQTGIITQKVGGSRQRARVRASPSSAMHLPDGGVSPVSLPAGGNVLVPSPARGYPSPAPRPAQGAALEPPALVGRGARGKRGASRRTLRGPHHGGAARAARVHPSSLAEKAPAVVLGNLNQHQPRSGRRTPRGRAPPAASRARPRGRVREVGLELLDQLNRGASSASWRLFAPELVDQRGAASRGSATRGAAAARGRNATASNAPAAISAAEAQSVRFMPLTNAWRTAWSRGAEWAADAASIPATALSGADRAGAGETACSSGRGRWR